MRTQRDSNVKYGAGGWLPIAACVGQQMAQECGKPRPILNSPLNTF
jgi:hypothetical protein